MRLLNGNRTIGLVLVLLLLGPFFMFVSWSRSRRPVIENSHAQEESKEAEDVVFAAPGRVEGSSEVINLGAGMDGLIRELRVREGQEVQAGQVLAVIDRGDLRSELNEARANAESARQARLRLIRGSRSEQRSEAEAGVNALEATVRQAQLRFDRYDNLFRQGVVSTDQRDEAKKNLAVAEAGLRAAVKHSEFVNASPLPEEVEQADAAVTAADERVRALSERLEKTLVRAPISGTVLKTLMRPGETFSTFTPQAILTLADISIKRVRAEVDEADIARVYVHQRVRVQGDSVAKNKLMGTVVRIGSQMGRKKIRVDEPAERSDRDVLEVMIDLDETTTPLLLINVRVTIQFLNGG